MHKKEVNCGSLSIMFQTMDYLSSLLMKDAPCSYGTRLQCVILNGYKIIVDYINKNIQCHKHYNI